MDIGGRGIDATIAASTNREVQDVAPQAVGGEIADGGTPGKFVGSEERRIDQAGGSAHAPRHQVMERDAGDSLGDHREQHITGVVIGEPRVWLERRGVAIERHEILLGRCELVDRNGHDIVGDFLHRILVEIVTDA